MGTNPFAPKWLKRNDRLILNADWNSHYAVDYDSSTQVWQAWYEVFDRRGGMVREEELGTFHSQANAQSYCESHKEIGP
jgi:hypothetical protein